MVENKPLWRVADRKACDFCFKLVRHPRHFISDSSCTGSPTPRKISAQPKTPPPPKNPPRIDPPPTGPASPATINPPVSFLTVAGPLFGRPSLPLTENVFFLGPLPSWEGATSVAVFQSPARFPTPPKNPRAPPRLPGGAKIESQPRHHPFCEKKKTVCPGPPLLSIRRS